MSSTSSPATSNPRPRPPTRLAPPTPAEDLVLPTTTPSAEEQSCDDIPVTHDASTASPASPDPDPNTASDLTPLRAHYLKKALIQECIERELDLLTSQNSNLAFLGPPFNPPPKDTPPMDLPFIRYLFRQFVLTFPFMASAPNDFYSAKLQPFFTSVLSRNLSPTSAFEDESAETATRQKIMAKLQRNLSLFVGSATKLEEKEDVVRLTQTDLDRLENLAQKRSRKMAKERDNFEVNIVCVRTVVDKGRIRSRAHDEFIIRTRHSRSPEVYVSRRYGDFRTLAEQLRKIHPNEPVPSPPAKDRTTVHASAPSPVSPVFSPRQQQSLFTDASSLSSTDSINSVQSTTTTRHGLSREKNRLTLRAYLHSILAASSTIASSPVLQSFLTANPTRLSPVEVEDAKRREEADNIREEGRKKFAKEIASRVDGLRNAVRGVKVDVMSKDGLSRIFGIVKVIDNVCDLPPEYQAVLEWGRVSLASTIFQNFVAADSSSETFAALKRIHGLMPYFMLKAALKISNPIGMVRTVLDLFMAQPFGGRSLLQRMFTSSLSEEVNALQEDIEAVMRKVGDPVICEKIQQFVYAPKEIQDMLKADSAAEKQNLITIVLRSGDQPFLNQQQMNRVARAHRAHALYMKHKEQLTDSDDDDGPVDEAAWLYEDLKVLANMYSRLRDREMLIAIIFEGSTADLLKDIITIFYAPLAQVYKAASISDSLGDMQNFINDLIKTVEQVDENSQRDPGRTVQAFIDLVQRHEQSFYTFVHRVHSKGEGLFDSLMRWLELFITLVREGLPGPPLSLEVLLPHPGTPERKNLLEEVDKIARYHYRLKVMYEDKLRRRFGRADAAALGGAEAEDEATQMLVDGVIGDIGFSDLAKGDADDMAAEDDEDEDDSDELEDSSEEDSDDDSSSGSYTNSDDSSEGERSTESYSTAPQRSAGPSNRAPAGVQQHSSPRTPNHGKTSTPRQSPAQITASSSSTPRGSLRQRSLSLTSKRSLSFLRSPSSGQNISPPPPVPPLPSKPSSAAFDKPLPPSPGRYSLPDAPRSAPLRSSTSSAPPAQTFPPKRRLKQRNKVVSMQPPELQYIPTVLPIFIEMMRPHLRVRRSTAEVSRTDDRPLSRTSSLTY